MSPRRAVLIALNAPLVDAEHPVPEHGEADRSGGVRSGVFLSRLVGLTAWARTGRVTRLATVPSTVP